MELLPTKATFAPGEPVVVEARGTSEGETLRLLHLDRVVAEVRLDGSGHASFPPQAEGGYGVDADGVSTAVDVLDDPLRRPRYGFVSQYEADRATDGVAENVRRFHLNAVQFYDWMYRHAKLMPPTDEFDDALGRRISLATVRRLAAAVREAGSLPFAYAAVYAVGKEAWPEWEADGLFRRDGSPWMLGDFLWNVDPTSERWLSHFSADLRSTLEVGFAGFHLDQYGSPKWALRRDGTRVDLVEAFPALIDRVAADVPEARLIFNNVNDFPTFATVRAAQALTYIEVWAPHTRLRHLAELVSTARLLAPDRPVVLAAYLSAYQGDEVAALQAEKLQLATVFSHGGTVLLHGEESAVLTEAYYVKHRLGDARDAGRRAPVLRLRRALRRPALRRRHARGDAHASRRRQRGGADRGAGARRDRRRGGRALGTCPAAAAGTPRQPDRSLGAGGRHVGRAEERERAARRRSALDPPPRPGRAVGRGLLARRASVRRSDGRTRRAL